jgi:predicted nucleic acid-binding protein
MEQPELEVIWMDEDLHLRAMQLLEARLDKRYSLCDAVSFELMRQRDETDALTTDHHFEQEGFVLILRP